MKPIKTNPRVWLAVLALMWGVTAACWSSDSAFITLTATPIPTAVPPTPEQALESLYAVGQKLKISGGGLAVVYLTASPEPATRRNRLANGVCNVGSDVEISAVSSVDGVTYYRIACNSTPGWLAESVLVGATK